jgi:hypothetical protein
VVAFVMLDTDWPLWIAFSGASRASMLRSIVAPVSSEKVIEPRTAIIRQENRTRLLATAGHRFLTSPSSGSGSVRGPCRTHPPPESHFIPPSMRGSCHGLTVIGGTLAAFNSAFRFPSAPAASWAYSFASFLSSCSNFSVASSWARVGEPS